MAVRGRPTGGEPDLVLQARLEDALAGARARLFAIGAGTPWPLDRAIGEIAREWRGTLADRLGAAGISSLDAARIIAELSKPEATAQIRSAMHAQVVGAIQKAARDASKIVGNTSGYASAIVLGELDPADRPIPTSFDVEVAGPVDPSRTLTDAEVRERAERIRAEELAALPAGALDDEQGLYGSAIERDVSEAALRIFAREHPKAMLSSGDFMGPPGTREETASEIVRILDAPPSELAGTEEERTLQRRMLSAGDVAQELHRSYLDRLNAEADRPATVDARMRLAAQQAAESWRKTLAERKTPIVEGTDDEIDALVLHQLDRWQVNPAAEARHPRIEAMLRERFWRERVVTMMRVARSGASNDVRETERAAAGTPVPPRGYQRRTAEEGRRLLALTDGAEALMGREPTWDRRAAFEVLEELRSPAMAKRMAEALTYTPSKGNAESLAVLRATKIRWAAQSLAELSLPVPRPVADPFDRAPLHAPGVLAADARAQAMPLLGFGLSDEEIERRSVGEIADWYLGLGSFGREAIGPRQTERLIAAMTGTPLPAVERIVMARTPVVSDVERPRVETALRVLRARQRPPVVPESAEPTRARALPGRVEFPSVPPVAGSTDGRTGRGRLLTREDFPARRAPTIAIAPDALSIASARVRGLFNVSGPITLSDRLHNVTSEAMRGIHRQVVASVRAGESLTRVAERILDLDARSPEATAQLPLYVREITDAARVYRDQVRVGGAGVEPARLDLDAAIARHVPTIRRLGERAPGGVRRAGWASLRSAAAQLVKDVSKAHAPDVDRILSRWILERATYQARVIARTEAVEGFTDTYVARSTGRPWIIGWRWRLSARHPKPDVCDAYAKLDAWRLGPGGYPVGPSDDPKKYLPRRHTSCLCTVTPIVDPHWRARRRASVTGTEPPKPWLSTGIRWTGAEMTPGSPKAWAHAWAEIPAELRAQILGPGREEIAARAVASLRVPGQAFNADSERVLAGLMAMDGSAPETLSPTWVVAERPRPTFSAVMAPRGAVARIVAADVASMTIPRGRGPTDPSIIGPGVSDVVGRERDGLANLGAAFAWAGRQAAQLQAIGSGLAAVGRAASIDPTKPDQAPMIGPAELRDYRLAYALAYRPGAARSASEVDTLRLDGTPAEIARATSALAALHARRAGDRLDVVLGTEDEAAREWLEERATEASQIVADEHKGDGIEEPLDKAAAGDVPTRLAILRSMEAKWYEDQSKIPDALYRQLFGLMNPPPGFEGLRYWESLGQTRAKWIQGWIHSTDDNEAAVALSLLGENATLGPQAAQHGQLVDSAGESVGRLDSNETQRLAVVGASIAAQYQITQHKLATLLVREPFPEASFGSISVEPIGGGDRAPFYGGAQSTLDAWRSETLTRSADILVRTSNGRDAAIAIARRALVGRAISGATPLDDTTHQVVVRDATGKVTKTVTPWEYLRGFLSRPQEYDSLATFVADRGDVPTGEAIAEWRGMNDAERASVLAAPTMGNMPLGRLMRRADDQIGLYGRDPLTVLGRDVPSTEPQWLRGYKGADLAAKARLMIADRIFGAGLTAEDREHLGDEETEWTNGPIGQAKVAIDAAELKAKVLADLPTDSVREAYAADMARVRETAERARQLLQGAEVSRDSHENYRLRLPALEAFGTGAVSNRILSSWATETGVARGFATGMTAGRENGKPLVMRIPPGPGIDRTRWLSDYRVDEVLSREGESEALLIAPPNADAEARAFEALANPDRGDRRATREAVQATVWARPSAISFRENDLERVGVDFRVAEEGTGATPRIPVGRTVPLRLGKGVAIPATAEYDDETARRLASFSVQLWQALRSNYGIMVADVVGIGGTPPGDLRTDVDPGHRAFDDDDE